MKRILFFILIATSISTRVFSQGIGFENKFINVFEEKRVIWKSCLELDFEGIENPINETILYGDTLINEVKWIIFNKNGIKGLIRTEDAKVIFTPYPRHEDHFMYEYRGNETVIYDFSLNVGDVFGFGGKVVEIDSIMLNDGKKHKKLYFENSNYNYIEGLGSDVYEPFFMLFPTTTMASYPTFMCCHVGNELLYMNPAYSDCDGNRVSNEVINNDHLNVNILLLDETLRITLENNNSFNVNVYSLNGTLVTQKNENYNTAYIPLKGMSKGIYVIQIISGNSIYSSKIVKK